MTGTKMNRVNFVFTILALALLSCVVNPVYAGSKTDRETMQAELDAACEEAREEKLAPLRAGFVEECVENGDQPSREACEIFYADFGAQSGDRAPLFYDLPECVEAFNYQNSQRQG